MLNDYITVISFPFFGQEDAGVISCLRCNDTFEVVLDEFNESKCPQCGNHKVAKEKWLTYEISEVLSIDKKQDEIRLLFANYTFKKNSNFFLEPEKSPALPVFPSSSNKTEFVIIRETATSFMDGHYFLHIPESVKLTIDKLSNSDFYKVLYAIEPDVAKLHTPDAHRGTSLLKAIFFFKYPKLKVLGVSSEFSYSPFKKTFFDASSVFEKEIDVAKYFIPKSTPKNLYLMRNAMGNIEGSDTIVAESFFYKMIEKPETLSNFFSAVKSLNGRLKNKFDFYHSNVEIDECVSIIKTNLNDGVFDHFVNLKIKSAIRHSDINVVQCLISTATSLLSDIYRLKIFLTEKFSFVDKENILYEEILNILEGNKKFNSLKKLHDYLSDLSNKTVHINYIFPIDEWSADFGFTKGEYTVDIIRDSKTLRTVAEEMSNCIFSYETEMFNSDVSRFLLIQKNDKPIFVMLLKTDDSRTNIAIIEAKKRYNQLLIERDIELIEILDLCISKYQLNILTNDLTAVSCENFVY